MTWRDSADDGNEDDDLPPPPDNGPFPDVGKTLPDPTLGLCDFCGGRYVRLGTPSGWTRLCPTCPMPGPATP